MRMTRRNLMNRKLHRLLCVAGLVIVSFIGCIAQTAAANDDADLQSWNDVQLTIPLNKKVDFTTAVTMRLGKNISRLNDGRFAVGLSLKPLSSLAVQPFYWLVRARRSNGLFGTEHRLNLRAIYKFPVKSIGISHRSWFEYRIRSTGNTWRYRPSITVEKAIPNSIVSGLKAFVTEEPFYDSATGRFSRNRFSVGVNKILSKKLSLDLFYLRQDDSVAHPSVLHVIGTAWRIKL